MTRPSLAGIEKRAEAHQNWQSRFNSRERVETALASAADVPALRAAVGDVLALHQPEPCGDVDHTPGECAGDAPCIECFVEYPCPTVRALATHLDLTDPEGEPT